MASLYLEREYQCPYVSTELTRNLFFQSNQISASQYDVLLLNGWRHFGALFFRPFCDDCSKCQSLVVDVSKFHLSKSMKRICNKNKDLKITFQPASVTQEHLDLINKFQSERSQTRSWELQVYDQASYANAFLSEADWSWEMTIRNEEGKLIGVSLVDFGIHSQSSVYFYSDPEESQRSLGTWSVIQEILKAQESDRHRLYLGLWNDETPSLNYKARFSPHEKKPYQTLDEGFLNFIKSL